jgi:DNA-binding transcriptional MerR regulator
MAEADTPIEIPRRALFKAAEVCELMHVQPYVLRTWEAEFPNLGVSKGGGPRVYRRSDVEQVARIKRLLLVDGLTLAGARRKIEEDAAPAVAMDDAGINELIGQNARERLTEVKRGLRSILELLAGSARVQDRLRFDSPRTAAVRPSARGQTSRSTKSARGKAASRASGSSRRKRSA